MCVSGRFKKIFRQQGWVHPSTGTAPIRHLDRSRVKRKIQLEFLPHIPLTFHKDFQKPDSQPETKTLWAEKKKNPTTPPFPPCRRQTRQHGEKRTRQRRLQSQVRKRAEKPRPLALPPTRGARIRNQLPQGSPEASAPRPAGRWSVPALAPPWRGNPPEVLISGIRGWR